MEVDPDAPEEPGTLARLGMTPRRVAPREDPWGDTEEGGTTGGSSGGGLAGVRV